MEKSVDAALFTRKLVSSDEGIYSIHILKNIHNSSSIHILQEKKITLGIAAKIASINNWP
jgi:hypothetical protein